MGKTFYDLTGPLDSGILFVRTETGDVFFNHIRSLSVNTHKPLNPAKQSIKF